jgi:hypothetical protein
VSCPERYEPGRLRVLKESDVRNWVDDETIAVQRLGDSWQHMLDGVQLVDGRLRCWRP